MAKKTLETAARSAVWLLRIELIDALGLHSDRESDALVAGALEERLRRHDDTGWSSEAGRSPFELMSGELKGFGGTRAGWTDATDEGDCFWHNH